MFHRDHAPPHLHAQFGAYEITVELQTCDAQGRFPAHALRAVRQWIELHRAELINCWQLASELKPIPRVPPLE